MIILGINYSHDSSLTLIKDGKILSSIEEEKISRVKQDIGWPRNAIDRILYENNIEKSDIKIISMDKMILESISFAEIKYRFYKKSFHKYQEYFRRVLFYFGFQKFKIDKIKSKKTIDNLIKNEGFINAVVNYHEHHLSHAASVFYTSPIKLDLIVTSDGMGGKSSFNFYFQSNNKLKLVHSNDYTVSVGAFYSMITKLLGFKPMRHEGKITGLAAYGKKTKLLDLFRNLWTYDKNKLTRFPFDNVSYYVKKYSLYKNLSLLKKINLETSTGKINSDYDLRNMLLFELLKRITNGYSKEDIAYACQKVSEEITISEIKRIIKRFKLNEIKVGLAGGVFANVRINQIIYELKEVKNIFIQPAMGDSGLALGNAILSSILSNKKNAFNKNYKFKNSYLGPDFSKDLADFIKKFKSEKIKFEKLKKPSLRIAKLLNQNKIIGLWNGRIEWGPRALGNRSIILNTFDKSVNDTLNKRLNRTEFMPFAPVVLDTHAKKYFPNYDDNVPAAKYMTITYDTNPEYQKMLQATVHIDGTARPQVIDRKNSPYYYSILYEFSKLSNCGALVNTSFNAHEEPILSTPQTAIKSLMTNRVDYLVMNDYLFYKI